MTVDFFFDVSSPWTYLGFEGLVRAAEADGFGIRYRPFLVGGVFNSVNPSVYEMRANPVPAKARYMAKDLADWAQFYGVTIKWTPSVFPVNSARAMRACLVADTQGHCEPLARRLFEAYWAEDQDISQPEVIAAASLAAGLDADAVLAAVDLPETKAQLRANTDELIARGGFGTPTVFIGDAMFFGQDRLPLIRAAARP